MNQSWVERQRPLNQAPVRPGPVICWLSRDLRAEDHWGLISAQDAAIQRRVPLIAVFCWQPDHLNAPDHSQAFLLSGLAMLKEELSALNIPLILIEGHPGLVIPSVAEQLGAGEVFCDFSPLRLPRQQRDAVAASLSVRLTEVDTHNIIPCWLAYPKQAFGAHILRPFIQRQLAAWLTPFPQMERHPFTDEKLQTDERLILQDLPPLSPDQLLKQRYRLPRHFPRPGSRAAQAQLIQFVEKTLYRYDQRNDPNADACSALSPWLHFGQLSAQRVALTVRRSINEAGDADTPDQLMLQNNAASFLEELIVRRELSDNFCFYQPDYDQVSGFPDWARETLNRHREDPRPYLYHLEQLTAAETEDPLWNAAQTDLRVNGRMHGYLRMYWAKKILEWSFDPESALAAAIDLNDQLALDGRDPNGYTGIAWSIGGVHDRAWGERPIFGKIRYMSLAGCRRKFDVDLYIRTVMT